MRRVRWRGNAILGQLADATDPALYQGAEVILAEAQRRVPVRTGTLRDSGYVGIKGRSTYPRRKGFKRERRAWAGVAVVAFAAQHSHLIENGTRRFKKRPFLRPALHSTADAVGGAVAEVMGRSLE